ncbi:MAG: response regulator [Spirochaetota bacterium]
MDDKNKNCILIVDDKKENLNLLTAVLKKYGYKFLTAKSGEESISVMNIHDEIGLVLMDIKMTGINGTDAMIKIKEKSNIPIIAITGFTGENNRKEFIAQGFNDYISKPIDIKLLIKKIEYLISYGSAM